MFFGPNRTPLKGGASGAKGKITPPDIFKTGSQEDKKEARAEGKK